MKEVIMIKYAELTTKKDNRNFFINTLEIIALTREAPHCSVPVLLSPRFQSYGHAASDL